MIPDYSKTEFTQDEKNLMQRQSQIIRNKYPNKIPILLRIKSKILTAEKYKYLVPDNLTMSEIITGITIRLSNINSKTLIFCISTLKDQDTIISDDIHKMKLQDIYTKYKDPEIDTLILSVSRNTLFKWTKSLFF